MMDILQNIIAFIFAIGVLITFHEYGHYWVARKCDVKILRFSIGFGRAIYRRKFGKDNTEFVIAALPLGGYVKMLDEREGQVAKDELPRAFNNKSLIQRFLIVLAGPVFNFIFAIFAYWLIFSIGIDGLKPVIGQVEKESIAYQAGIRADGQIISVDGVNTATWTAVLDNVVGSVVEGRQISVNVLDSSGMQGIHHIDLAKISIDDMAGGKLLDRLGIKPKRPVIPPVIGKIITNGAAEKAGLVTGDRILAVDGKTIKGWRDWVEIIRSNPQKNLNIELLRNEQPVSLIMTPQSFTTDTGEVIGRIGAVADNSFVRDRSYLAKEKYSIFAALVKAMDKTVEMSLMTLRILGKMLLGEASVKNLSGPISIAQYAGETAGIGIIPFLGFLAIVSISLGVLNLLPIPLLDGGHLMYYLIELVKGSPVSESAQMIGQQVGIAALICLMSVAFYNDILRIIG